MENIKGQSLIGSNEKLITNCTFSNISSHGGAVYFYYAGNVTLSNCVFKNNQAQSGSSINFFQESNILLISFHSKSCLLYR